MKRKTTLRGGLLAAALVMALGAFATSPPAVAKGLTLDVPTDQIVVTIDKGALHQAASCYGITPAVDNDGLAKTLKTAMFDTGDQTRFGHMQALYSSASHLAISAVLEAPVIGTLKAKTTLTDELGNYIKTTAAIIGDQNLSTYGDHRAGVGLKHLASTIDRATLDQAGLHRVPSGVRLIS